MSDLASKIIALSPATTAGSGELNLVGSPSNGSGWLSANGGGTLSTTSTAGDLPLGPAVTTAIKITSGTGASVEATLAQTNSYSFTTPASYAVKTKVELWLRPGSNFINSEWTVSVYAGSTRQALTTDASSITYLPNANGKFTTTFMADASTAYTLRFTRTVNALTNAAVLNVANVIVGPGIQPQGAVVEEWKSYTPVGNDQWTANATYAGKYRRVGDTMEVFAKVAAGATIPTGGVTAATRISLPTGFTIDTTKLNSGSANESSLGTWQGTIFGVGNLGGQIRKHTSNLQVELWMVLPDAGDYKSSFTTISASQITNGGAQNSIAFAHFTVPIAEWAGSGTVNLAQNDVEYAYNTSTSDAADTTSFGYGPSGNTVVGALTSTRSKRVRFKSPIQVGDSLIVEVQASGGGQWNPVVSGDPSTGIGGLTFQTTAFTYGIGISTTSINATDVDVSFGKYQFSSGATYASAGTAWSTSAANWRIKKISGGQAVGFGAFQAASTANPAGISGLVPALGLPGRTDGVAVAAGYVGEKLVATTFTPALVNNTRVAAATISLTPGVYMLFGTIGTAAAALTGTRTICEIGSDASSTVIYAGSDLPLVSSATTLILQSLSAAIVISTTTTIYFNVRVSFTGGSGTAATSGQAPHAVRIA